MLKNTRKDGVQYTPFGCIFAHKNVAHKKNNKKREAALKNEAGGDEKRFFFF